MTKSLVIDGKEVILQPGDPFLTQELNRVTDIMRKTAMVETRNRIERETFVKLWLPLIISKVDSAKQAGGGPPIAMWVDEIAGSVYSAVDVVEGGHFNKNGVYDGGEVVYTVPPMVNKNALSMSPMQGLFNAIMQVKAMVSSGHIAEANRLQAQLFDGRSRRIPDSDTFLGDMNKMLIAEGYKPFPSAGTAEEAAVKEEENGLITTTVSDF